MFNDRFNDRVRRYRVRALLVLAGLVLFGLGAGHFATQALGAGGTIPATTVFSGDPFNIFDTYKLKSDSGLPYVDGTDCVENVLVGTKGSWSLLTAHGDCSAPRSFTLVLGTTDQGCPLMGRGTRPLYLCGSTSVWGNMATNAFTSTPLQGANPMNVYLKTAPAPTEPFAFVLEYKNRFEIAPYAPGSNTRTVSTPSSFGGADADLYQYVNGPGGKVTLQPVPGGHFIVPCSITITKQ